MISIYHIHYDVVIVTIYIEISMKNLSSLNQISFFSMKSKIFNESKNKELKEE